ncbi:MAG: hypothetical protein QM666_10340 [Acinetobacter sp.]
MRKKLLMMVLLSSYGPLGHSAISSETQCTSLSEGAKEVMTLRQKNIPIEQVIPIFDQVLAKTSYDDKKVEQDTKKIVHRLIEEAYKVPVGSNAEMQTQAIVDFQARLLKECQKLQ